MYCQKWIYFALTLVHVGPCMHNCDTKDMEQDLMRSQIVNLSEIRRLLVAQEEMMSTLLLKSGQLKSDLDKQNNYLKDKGPQFLDGPYEATVPEMSPEGTSVIQVTATYPTGVRLIYSILPEQPYFSVEPTSGVVRTAYPGDRETQDKYFVVIKATVEQIGGPSGTTTVTINLSDVNDNPPRFQHKRYEMNVSEAAPLGTILGKIMANDSDIGDNAAMDYIIEDDNPHIICIITNNDTQEGIVILNKTVDYESQRAYKIKVKGINRHVEKHFLEKDAKFEDETILRITVKDADEPPVFLLEEFFMEVPEDNLNGSFVGTVSARDPDDIDSPIRYSITHHKYLKTFFSINAHNGTISITGPLDREKQIWHNLTVTAIESINPKQMSEVNVYIKVLDANEYAPEFAEYYETYVCENSRAGQIVANSSLIVKSWIFSDLGSSLADILLPNWVTSSVLVGVVFAPCLYVACSTSIGGIFGAVRTGAYMVYILMAKGLKQSVCDQSFYNGPVSKFWAYAFVLSKAPELGDTIFIILRKQKLIFLHWYHHITVLLYSWYSYKDMVAGGGWFMTMNYGVHAVMYTYYALRAAGFRVSRKFAMFITLSQITQMFVGCIINYLVFAWMQQGQCHSHVYNVVWCSLMYLSYFVLFCHFFFDAYIGKTRKARKAE